MECLSRRLGRLRPCAKEFERLGGGWEVKSICVGVSSGSSVEVSDRCTPTAVIVDANMLTPLTCRGSKGWEIISVFVRAMVEIVCAM
jgi:hypothetical protein